MKTNESNDTKILRLLYTYYRAHPGEPKMGFSELLEKLEDSDAATAYDALTDLQNKHLLDGTFLADGQAGLVWLTPDGISITKQLLQEQPQQTPSPQAQTDVPPQSAFVPNCRYDVFVSYTLPEEEAKHWQVNTTTDTLREKITNTFQARQQSLVWGENPDCNPEILPELSASAIRIFIVSERYVRKSAELAEPNALFARSSMIKQGQKIIILEFDEAGQSFGEHEQTVRYALWEHPDMIGYHNLLSDIAQDVCTILHDLHEKTKVLTQIDMGHRGKTVFIDHDAVDAPLAESLSKKIETELHSTIFLPESSTTPPSERNEWFTNNVLLCDGVLVLYGAVKRQWIQAKLLQIGKLLTQRDESLSVYAVYIGPPEKTNVLPVKGIKQIDCQQCPMDAEGCQESVCEHQLVEHFISVLQ